MTFNNRRKVFGKMSGPVPYDSKRHTLWPSDFYLYRDGIAVARLRSDPDHAEWVIPNKVQLFETPVDKVEPVEVALTLKLHTSTWAEVKMDIQRSLRSNLRYVSKCIRNGYKIVKKIK